MMNPKTWLAVSLLPIAAAAVIGFWYWNSPERRIRAVLSDGEAALEAEDLKRAMSHVSLHYRDTQGLTYLTVKKLLKRGFDRFDGLDVRIWNVKIEIQEDLAFVRADLEVMSSFDGEKAYVIGRWEQLVPITIRLSRERLRWLVQSVDGIPLPLGRGSPLGR